MTHPEGSTAAATSGQGQPQTPRGIPTYLVMLETPQGRAQMEVPTLLGAAAAGRRAMWTGIAAGWGDVGEVHVSGIEPIG